MQNVSAIILTALVRSFHAPGSVGSSLSGPFVILVSGKREKATLVLKFLIFILIASVTTLALLVRLTAP